MAEPSGASSFQQQIAMGAGGGADPGHYPGIFAISPKGIDKAGGVMSDKNLSPFQGNENVGGIASILTGAMGSSSKNMLRAIFAAVFPSESLKNFSSMTATGPWGIDPHALAADKDPRQFITGGGAGDHGGMAGGHHYTGGEGGSSSSGDSGGGGGGGGSNHVFTAAFGAGGGLSGHMSDVNMANLGGLHPDPSPGVGAGRDVGMGM
jgi:hypothetical protein